MAPVRATVTAVSIRSLVTVAVVVWSIAVLVAVFLGLPMLLTVEGVHVEAGLVVNALAAGIALSAAVIAFQSVGRQIKANAEDVNRQINAQADAVAAQIAADRSERKRAERIPLVYDAIAVITKLAEYALSYEYWTGVKGSPVNDEEAEKSRQRFFRVETVPICQKLDLVGMSLAAEAVGAVWEQTRLVIDPHPWEERADVSTARQAEEHAASLLRTALSDDG
jgi:hypothetical protein